VAQYSQDSADGPRMASEGDICAVVVSKDIIEQLLQARIQSRIGLTNIGFPERIVFSKASLEVVAGKMFVNPGLTTSAVAAMDADNFAKWLHLLSKCVTEYKLVKELTSFTIGRNGFRLGSFKPEKVISAVARHLSNGLV